MLQRALQWFTSKLFFKAEHQFQLSIFSSDDQTLTMLKIPKGCVMSYPHVASKQNHQVQRKQEDPTFQTD